MSTLQQNLQQRRDADSAAVCCVIGPERQAALVVATWQGATWILPWTQFVSAHFAKDSLDLVFVGNHVVVTGRQLHGLLDDLAAFRIGCLRDLPADYRKKAADDAPFISKIEVRSLTALGSAREVPG